VVIAAQAKAIEELTAANARLVDRVTALERTVGRNSGNSSMTPSCDDLPGRKKPKSVKWSGRKRGKQPGRGGQFRCRGWRSR
jgi:transposase